MFRSSEVGGNALLFNGQSDGVLLSVLCEIDHCAAIGPCSTCHMTPSSLLVCVKREDDNDICVLLPVLQVWSTRDFSLLKVLAGHEGKVMGADLCPCRVDVLKANSRAGDGAEDMEGVEGGAAAGGGGGSEGHGNLLRQHLIGSVSYDRTIKLWQPEEVPDLGLDLEFEVDGMMEGMLE